MIAGIGSTLDVLYRQSDLASFDRLDDRHVEDGFEIDVEATSLATPYPNGVANPTGVFGGLLSGASVVDEVEARGYGGGDGAVTGGASCGAVALGGDDDAAMGQGGRDRLRGPGGATTGCRAAAARTSSSEAAATTR